MLQYRDMRRTGARCPHPRGRGALRLELEGMEGARALEDFLPFWKGEVCAFFCRSRRRGCAGNKPPMRKGRLGGMTHPCPAGQGYAAGVRDRRCLPLRGKSASELARLILVCRGAKLDEETVCPSGTVWQARRKRRKHTVLRSMRPPRPRNHPAGGTAGSARTRSRDQSLENPFLGTAPLSPNAAGGRPLLVGLPPSTRSTAPTGTNRSAQAPYSWGLGASTSSRRLLAVGPADRPPAEAELALVEDGRLAGSDGALGRVERYARSVSVNDRARGL